MAYNNTAYDLERFAPRAPKQAPKKAVIKKFPGKNAKQSPKNSIVLSAIVSIAIVIMVCCNIYLRTEINDTNNAIRKANKEIETLTSIQTQLNVEMENLVSYSTLEQQATALGMQKRSKSQVHYIDTSAQDYAECYMNMWSEIDAYHAGNTVCMPVMGSSGIVRIQDNTPQLLLENILWTFRLSGVNLGRTASLRIIVHESMADDIDFLRLKNLGD